MNSFYLKKKLNYSIVKGILEPFKMVIDLYQLSITFQTLKTHLNIYSREILLRAN